MAIDAEMDRMMRNWALWRSGSLTGVPSSGAYELEARGRHEETSMPLINGEAVEVDQAINALDSPLKLAIEEFWLRAGPVEGKARRCGCGTATLYRRLERAYVAINHHRRTRREAAERRRAALAHSHSENRPPE